MRWHPLALVVFLSALVSILPHTTMAIDSDAALNEADNLADSGFRPDVNGFGFQNYGSDLSVVDLTPIEMQRMFGDQVCASTIDGNCVLTLPAQRWMNQAIKAMSYGHCEGIAVLSDLIYYYQKNPDEFGGSQAIELSLDNELLQREIGYWWVTQVTNPGGANKVSESPNAVLEVLMEAFKNGSQSNEWWVMGIYQPDGSEGHSITPYAVEDAGNGIYRIFVYDNNWPKEVRYVTVDRDSNAWSYQSSINPNEPASLYAGNASTHSLEIVSISSRLGQQQCDFCSQNDTSDIGTSKGALAGERKVQIWQDGKARVLVTDEQGRRIGNLPSGKLVNEIPGAELRKLRFAANSELQPIIFVPIPPESPRFNVTVDSSADDLAENTAETTIIAPGFAAVSSIPDLEPGQRQSIDLNLDEGEDGYSLIFSSNQMETPIISIDSDFRSVTIDGIQTDSRGSIDIGMNPADNSFSMKSHGNSNPGTIQLKIKAIDPKSGEQFNFTGSDIPLRQNDGLSLNFSDSPGAVSILSLDVIHENGDVDKFDLQSMSSNDQPDSFINVSSDAFPDMFSEDDFGDFDSFEGDNFGSTGSSGFPGMTFP